jgi:hypothetical protein
MVYLSETGITMPLNVNKTQNLPFSLRILSSSEKDTRAG